jgi:ribosomal protein S18 acetylase RimI-like enzyme
VIYSIDIPKDPGRSSDFAVIPYSIRPANDADLDAVRTLLREYAAELAVDLCFQDFETELQTLPGKYGQPQGALLIGERDGETLGMVALRSLDEGVCEMKRLYVRPSGRGTGLGRSLAEAIIAEARRLGYRTMRLDTLLQLAAATRLYESLGFLRIQPYYQNPNPAMFFELVL